MASEFKKYSNVTVAINGTLSAQATSIQLTLSSNDQMVKTILLGMAGSTEGAKTCEYSIDFVIPSSGFEVNFSKLLAVSETVSLEFRVGGNVCVLTDAVIQSSQLSYAVDGITSLSISGFSSFSQFD